MNYGKDDLDTVKTILGLIKGKEDYSRDNDEDAHIIDWCETIIERWDGYLSITQMIDNRLSKYESYAEKDKAHFSKIKADNERLRRVNTLLLDVIAKIGIDR